MDTTLLSIARNALPETLRDAAAMLRSGRLVILPTETVYSVALNPESAAARDRLRELKRTQSDPQWVIHLPDVAAARDWLPDMPPRTERFLHKAWPGPIGVEFPLTDAIRGALAQRVPAICGAIIATGRLHLRCPDQRTTQRVLELAACPIALVGAGLAGGEPPTEVALLDDRMTGGVDAVIDAGPTKYRQPSTVVRIDDTVRVVRRGALDARVVQRMAETMILFICTGNTCRSPMAAALAQRTVAAALQVVPRELPERGFVIASAGLHAGNGMPAAPEAIIAGEELHADLSRHRSQPVTHALIRRADRIYAMTESHLSELLETFPEASGKAARLDPGGDIDDPIGLSQEVYRDVAQRMDHLIGEQTPQWTAAAGR